MVNFAIDHFQWGKLDNENTQLLGGDFQIIAKTSRLRDFLSELALIPRVFGISPHNIDTFAGAYGWCRWRDGTFIIGYFQRSPNVEYSGRPHYFIQSHFILVPRELVETLHGDLYPFYSYFADIPRYADVTELSSIEVDTEELRALSSTKINKHVIPFVQSVFHKPLTILNGNDKSPRERLYILANLACCFPPEYRTELPYFTSLAPSASRSIFRFAFGEEAVTSTNFPSLENPPEVDVNDPGFEYMNWLRKQVDNPLDDAFFISLRFGVTKDGSMAELDRAAIFERRRANLQKLTDSNRYYRSASAFLDEYVDLMNDTEISYTLTGILEKQNGDLEPLAHALAAAFRAWNNESFDAWVRITYWQHLSRENFTNLLNSLSVVDQTVRLIDFLAETTAKQSLTQNQPNFQMEIFFNWYSTSGRKIGIYHLINLLIENSNLHSLSSATWWKFFQFIDLEHWLSDKASKILGQFVPQTFRFMKILSGGIYIQNIEELLIKSYKELDNLYWLYTSIAETISVNDSGLLSSAFIEWLTCEVARVNTEKTSAELEATFTFARDIFPKFIERLDGIYSGEAKRVEKQLKTLRHFIITVLNCRGMLQDPTRKEVLLLLLSALSQRYIEHISSPWYDLHSRDIQLEKWVDVICTKLSYPQAVPTSNLQMSFFQQMELAAYARLNEYPRNYLEAIQRWHQQLVNQVTPETLYVWIVIFGYFKRYPNQAGWISFNFEDAAKLIENLLNTILSCPISKARSYIRDFSKEINGIKIFEPAWRNAIGDAPLSQPSLPVIYWKEICTELAQLELLNERDMLLGNAEAVEELKQKSASLRFSMELVRDNFREVIDIIDKLYTKEHELNTAQLAWVSYFLTLYDREERSDNLLEDFLSLISNDISLRKIERFLADMRSFLSNVDRS